jgi:hypothetical protein
MAWWSTRRSIGRLPQRTPGDALAYERARFRQPPESRWSADYKVTAVAKVKAVCGFQLPDGNLCRLDPLHAGRCRSGLP